MFVFIAIGLLAGLLSGILGIGGGIVIVPSLVFFAKMSQKSAVGTSLGAMLLPVGALGVWAYWRDGHVDVKGALLISLGIFVGAYGGAAFARSARAFLMRLPPGARGSRASRQAPSSRAARVSSRARCSHETSSHA